MKFLDPGHWARALRNPIVLAGLAIDLAPIYAVLMWGWGAAPLVMLYWIENLIAGAMTLPRVVISGATFGAAGLLVGAFLCVFFVFHYGLFCAVHGTFLMVYLSMSMDDPQLGNLVMDVPGMIRAGLASGQHMIWVVALIAAWQMFVLIWEFGVKGEWRTTNPMAEMFAPYGRIIVLHISLFAGMAALMLLNEPMIGVLALILLRAGWGVGRNAKAGGLNLLPPTADMSREKFAEMLSGKSGPT